MRLSSFLALSGTALAAACASSSSHTDPAPVPAASSPAASPASPATPSAAQTGSGMMWQGDIRPEGGSNLGGTVMIMPAGAAQATATLTLTGATAGGTHPWHVHSGTCADKGPIVGPPSAYTPIAVDASGAARVEATLPFATPASGTYSVNVHMSPTQMGMIVGCADLRAGS